MPVTRTTTPLVLAASLLALACGDDGMDVVPAVELGTGATSFESLQVGDEIYVTQGPQGGFHVLGSVRVVGLSPGDADDLNDPDNPLTEFQLHRGATRVDGGAANYRQGLDRTTDDSYEMLGRLVILDIADDAELDDQGVTLSVTVTDRRGRSASDSIALTAIADPINP